MTSEKSHLKRNSITKHQWSILRRCNKECNFHREIGVTLKSVMADAPFYYFYGTTVVLFKLLSVKTLAAK